VPLNNLSAEKETASVGLQWGCGELATTWNNQYLGEGIGIF
jgi:hypothetical protein